MNVLVEKCAIVVVFGQFCGKLVSWTSTMYSKFVKQSLWTVTVKKKKKNSRVPNVMKRLPPKVLCGGEPHTCFQSLFSKLSKKKNVCFQSFLSFIQYDISLYVLMQNVVAIILTGSSIVVQCPLLYLYLKGEKLHRTKR